MNHIAKRVFLVEMATMSSMLFLVFALSTTEASPLILTSSSGAFNYPKSPRYPSATEHAWLIKVEERKHINLTLDVIDVEAYRGKCIDIIEIKDGNTSAAPLLGGYCNSNKPSNSILSSSNTLRVWFQSAKNSRGGLGFNASYTTMPDQACGGQLESFPGTFTTPRYPLSYPNNRECTWKIRAPLGMYIHVEFHGVYNLESSCRHMQCECVDILDIKDGGKHLRYTPSHGFCFAKPRAFTSKTNKVSVKFVSDYSERFEGFNASYTTSLTKECGADFWRDHGLVTSPNYPNSYHSYRTCIWRITAPPDHYVTITFHEFDINTSPRACLEDNVVIHDGYTEDSPLIAKMCNGSFVRKLNSTGNKLYIAFQSSFNLKARGFKATYASYMKGKFSSNVNNRKPRHMELSGLPPKKQSNTATNVIGTWWKTTLGVSILGIGF